MRPRLAREKNCIMPLISNLSYNYHNHILCRSTKRKKANDLTDLSQP